jgi:hypothetical protein
VLASLLTAVRRSVVACRMEQETNRFGGGGGWGKTMRMRPPRPVWGRWRSGTPVDRFHGFLGLPVEFEVEMPPHVLSARYLSFHPPMRDL